MNVKSRRTKESNFVLEDDNGDVEMAIQYLTNSINYNKINNKGTELGEE